MTVPQRKIAHIDMDCFYAAIEMRDNPELKDLPVAVGGSPKRRGVISTCNYLAREYGVHSAMATAYAIRLCPQLRLMPVRMSCYRKVSEQLRNIFQGYTSSIEPLSLDEAYLDLSGASLHRGSATLIAEDIRATIRDELGLTASAGIAPNKFIAKICSAENKPDGQFVVTPAEVDDFCRSLPLRKIPGVGKVTAKKLSQLGLDICEDVRRVGEAELVRHLGAFGSLIHQRAHGVDNRELTTSRVRKSVSVERTFPKDIMNPEDALAPLEKLFEELEARLRRHGNRQIRHQQIKLKFTDFTQTTMERSSTRLDRDQFRALLPLAWERGEGQGIRLLGLGVGFRDEDQVADEQLPLF